MACGYFAEVYSVITSVCGCPTEKEAKESIEKIKRELPNLDKLNWPLLEGERIEYSFQVIQSEECANHNRDWYLAECFIRLSCDEVEIHLNESEEEIKASVSKRKVSERLEAIATLLNPLIEKLELGFGDFRLEVDNEYLEM